MKKILLLGSLFCAACTPQAAGPNEVQRLERKLNDLRSFQAEQTAELTALQEEVRKLNGRVEQVEFRNSAPVNMAAQPQTGAMQPTVNTGGAAPAPIMPPATTGVASGETPPPIVPIGPLEEDEALAPHLDAQLARLFQDALYFMRRGQYRQALPLLDQTATYAANRQGHMQALFWKGVAFDGMGNNRDSLAAYNSVIQGYPGTARARLSLLRLASVFVRLGDTGTAKLTLQKLIAEAPGTAEAHAAQEKLQDL
jgi:TolA-binding protein